MGSWNLRLGLLVAALVAAGCSKSGEDVSLSGADLATSSFDEGCSAPARSSDGKYLFLDACPTGGSGGNVVRVDLATGDKTTVAAYAAADRIERLGTNGDRVLFGIRHAVDGNGRATAGVTAEVRDLSLATDGVPFQASADVASTIGALGAFMVTADGKYVAFAADKGAVAQKLFVAPVDGSASPVALDLGHPSSAVRWSLSGGTLIGHIADPTTWTGETLLVIDTGGASVATIASPRHVAWTSFGFGEGGTRPQEPFDGQRVLGFKQTEATGAQVGTVDPRTGAETVLDSARELTLVTDLGPDVVYTRVTQPAGSSVVVRELVKMSRAGGTATVLLTDTGPSFDSLRYGYDPLAVSKTSTYGVFGTRAADGSSKRWVVKLDGTGTPTAVDTTVTVHEQVGDRLLVVKAPPPPPAAPATPSTHAATPSAPSFQVLDLGTGSFNGLGPVLGSATSNLVGDGTVVQLQSCNTDDGVGGTRIVHATSADAPATPSACAFMPWASIPLATAASGILVYYSSSGPFPNYRYDVGVIDP